MFCCINLY